MSETTYDATHVITMPRKDYEKKQKMLMSKNPDKSIITLFSGLLKAPIREINIQPKTVTFTLETKHYPILSEPYTLEELKQRANDNNIVYGWVSLPLHQVIDTDFESFLDNLSLKLTGTELLSGTNYELICNNDDNLIFYVAGDISLILETWSE